MPNGYKKHNKTLSKHEQRGGSSHGLSRYSCHKRYKPDQMTHKEDAGKRRGLLREQDDWTVLRAKKPLVLKKFNIISVVVLVTIIFFF